MSDHQQDIILPDRAQDLHGLFLERVKRTPDATAYMHYSSEEKEWVETSWSEMADGVARWRTALSDEGLKPGDRVAIWIPNCIEWVMMEQAALSLGFVVVPLYLGDRPENVAYILNDAKVRLILLVGDNQFSKLDALPTMLRSLFRIVSLKEFEPDGDARLGFLQSWLPKEGRDISLPSIEPDSLASIVYTSGTTGSSKGVMLSHYNILWNAYACTGIVPIYTDDIFLSFLPLSHMFERTAGYYLPMMTGASVAYSRSIQMLSKDLLSIRPTIMVSVPRIFEKVYSKIKAGLDKKGPVMRMIFRLMVHAGWRRHEHEQGRGGWSPLFLLWPLLDRLVAKKVRDSFGGRMRLIVAGGAPLSTDVARVFVGAGLPLLQGYGMTEASPVISCNMIEKNIPESVGSPLRGLEVKRGKKDELLVRSPGIMLGYLNNKKATAETINYEGWLQTGDKVKIEDGYIFITGRIKEIIVMSNGENIPPVDIELAIGMEDLFEQVMVIGEGEAYLSALVVLDEERGAALAKEHGIKAEGNAHLREEGMRKLVLHSIAAQMSAFPGYAKIRRVALMEEPWTVENELITPTLKLKRKKILERFSDEVEEMYKKK